MEHLTFHRIAHAQRLLATTDAKVIDVANESGFPSLSRFYAAFRSVCGQTPNAFRQQVWASFAIALFALQATQ